MVSMASPTDISLGGERVQKGSILSIRGFVEDGETQKADSQLTHCLEGVIKEEKELRLKGRLMHFYEEDEFSPT